MNRKQTHFSLNRLVRGMLVGWVLLAVASLPSSLAASDIDSPTEGALSSSPWYDPETGELVPVSVKTVRDDSAHRDSRWLPGAQRVPERKSDTSPAASSSGGLFGSGLTWGNLFGWSLLVLILLAVVGLLVYIFSKADFDTASGSSANLTSDLRTDEQTVERMKQLPVELRQAGVNLRDDALRLMQQSKFDQAIILLFGHQLLLLDRAGLLRLTRGKTNGRYVRETRAADPSQAARLQHTVASFERSYFGRHSITSTEFATLWENNLELERALRASDEVAA